MQAAKGKKNAVRAMKTVKKRREIERDSIEFESPLNFSTRFPPHAVRIMQFDVPKKIDGHHSSP